MQGGEIPIEVVNLEAFAAVMCPLLFSEGVLSDPQMPFAFRIEYKDFLGGCLSQRRIACL